MLNIHPQHGLTDIWDNDERWSRWFCVRCCTAGASPIKPIFRPFGLCWTVRLGDAVRQCIMFRLSERKNCISENEIVRVTFFDSSAKHISYYSGFSSWLLFFSLDAVAAETTNARTHAAWWSMLQQRWPCVWKAASNGVHNNYYATSSKTFAI